MKDLAELKEDCMALEKAAVDACINMAHAWGPDGATRSPATLDEARRICITVGRAILLTRAAHDKAHAAVLAESKHGGLDTRDPGDAGVKVKAHKLPEGLSPAMVAALRWLQHGPGKIPYRTGNALWLRSFVSRDADWKIYTILPEGLLYLESLK